MARVFRITDATTRLFNDGELEIWTSASALTNWTATGSPTVAQSTANVMEGVYSARIRNTSTQAVRGVYQDVTDEIVESDVYYVRCWVYVAAGTVRLYAWDGGGTSNPVYAETAVSGWQQLVVKKTAPSTGIRVGLVAYSASSDGYFDLVQIATGHVEMIEGVEDATFRITNWRQNMPVEKSGGIFQDSPIADGRELIDSYWSNTQDTIEFNVLGISTETQDTIIAKWRELLRLIQKSKSYGTTSWQYDSVYCEAKAEDETNYRYTRVIYATIPDAEDQFHITFKQLAMLNISLNIEHGHWLSLPPGHEQGVLIANSELYDGRNIGNYSGGAVDYTTSERVFVSNKFAESNLTDIYFYDNSGASFGSNLMDASLPFDLVPSSAAINDLIYFGIDTSVLDSGVFNNLVFKTSGTLSAGTTVWEYWNGSSWATLTVTDTTNDGTRSFELDGDFAIVSWQPISDWATTSINGITARWIRLKFTATPTGTVEQIDQLIYSASWSYIEVDDNEIGGDIPALNKIRVRHTGDPAINTEVPTVFMMALRSVSRGENFRPYINLADEQNEAGITVSVGTNTSFADSNYSPSGRMALYAPTGTDPLATRVTVEFGDSIASEYIGKFRLYVRTRILGFETEYTMKVRIVPYFPGATAQEITREFDTLPFGSSNYIEVDFGEVVLPPNSSSIAFNESVNAFNIEIQLSSLNSTRDLELYDLILMPVDEWIGEFSKINENTNEILSETRAYLVVDSVNFFKKTIRAVVVNASDGGIEGLLISKANGNAVLQSNSRQRLWFRMAGIPSRQSSSSGFYTGLHWEPYSFSVLCSKAERYLSMRGNG